MTPSGLSCHLAASTQCQESDSYYHAESTAHTSLKAREETPSKEQSFTGNYILKINMRTRQELRGGAVRTVCQRVSHISSGNGFCSATAARKATPAPVRGGIRAGYLTSEENIWQLLTKRAGQEVWSCDAAFQEY